MVDDQSAVVAEGGEDPGVRTAPHSTVHRVLVLLKRADHLVTLGGRGAGEREGGGAHYSMQDLAHSAMAG